ncbi:MAG: hypothetical protein WBP72_08515 [Rhodocyclaceae bacterium]
MRPSPRGLVGNPWKALGPLTGEVPKLQVGRSFSQDQWAFLMEQLATYVESGALRRLRFALTFADATGLRLAELVQARAEDLAWVEFGAGGWMLSVLGKGGKLREVPVPEEVMTDLFNYLADRGLDPDSRVASNEGVFLLGKVDDVQRRLYWAEGFDARQGISTAPLYDQFKVFFLEAAEVPGRSDPRGAAHPRQYPLAAPHPRLPRGGGRYPDRSGPGQSGACVARHDHPLRHRRSQAAESSY